MNKKILIIVLIVVLILVISPIIWYNICISSVSKTDDEVVIEIELGSTTNGIIEKLRENNLIRSKLAFKIYTKLNKTTSFQAGKYKLNKNMNVKEITEALQKGIVYSQEQISITFLEGKNFRWIANKIEESTNNTTDDVYNLLQDEEYLDSIIEKYWFINKNIKNKDIYYPLEGYLFPDTYMFRNKDVSVKEIFEAMLNKMENVLSEYKDKIEENKYSVHKILTVASIIENEAVFDSDRKDISSVIYNRIKNKMSIGSDVTTYYAAKVDMGERDLYSSELNTYNPYNTRGPNMSGKLPVGPISTVSKNSIEAAISPNTTDYLYFVADSTGKIYFTKTYSEHQEMINKIKSQGLWIQFK